MTATSPATTTTLASGGACRFCGAEIRHKVVDLGMHPPCQSFVTLDRLNDMEPFYPLVVWVCEQCRLVQIGEHVSPQETFVEYGYYSSFSDAWLDHCHNDADTQIDRWGLGPDSLVVEVASNDGYFLRWFQQRGVPVLGIEPARNVAAVAETLHVPTMVEFFGRDLARQLAATGQRADLLAGKNVLAQVPDLNDFVAGLAILLAPHGVVEIEFPHLQRLIEGNQFDTIYHEHFSYFSLHAVERVFAAHGLTLFDVEQLWTHGGSLRIYARHADNADEPVTDRVHRLRAAELEAGYADLSAYRGFSEQVMRTKRDLLRVLIDIKSEGKSIAAYGAAGKGMTLLNYCGIRTDLVDFVADRNPYKWDRFCPGVHIPVMRPEAITEHRPDYVLILPWNLRDEITAQLGHIREWGGQFIVPIPSPQVF